MPVTNEPPVSALAPPPRVDEKADVEQALCDFEDDRLAQDLADKEKEKKALVPFLGLTLCLFLAALDQTSEYCPTNEQGWQERRTELTLFSLPTPLDPGRPQSSQPRCRP